MKDWREDLVNTMEGTEGCIFSKIIFTKTEQNEHEHCSICFSKISEYYGKEKSEGYYCEETNDWLCCKCFKDFQKKFSWRLK